MFFTFFVVLAIMFTGIHLLREEESPWGHERELEEAVRRAAGWDRPIPIQYGILIRNVFTRWDWGVSLRVNYLMPVGEAIMHRLPVTMLLSAYSILVSLPTGIGLGILAALRKNKLTDNIISTLVMICISVPGFVFAFFLQYFLSFRGPGLPMITMSLHEAGGSWFTWDMTRSLILPVLAMSFGTIAGFTRFVRAELTEALTSEYMLLARAKGLTRKRAVSTHAMKSAMVPVLPNILMTFIGIVGGTIIIERIFSVPGMGNLMMRSLELRDYNLYVAISAFYAIIGLGASIVFDISLGFLDPRIKMGQR